MAHPYPGILITFEGGEGSGKTLASVRLSKELESRGLPVLLLREPGATAIGDALRDIVHDLQYGGMSPMTEAYIYQAARAQIVHEKIKPALASGKVVILDRFRESSLAYQGYARGLGCGKIDFLNRLSTGGLESDLVIYMNVSPETGLSRRSQADEWNRMDAQAIEFHHLVREAYLTMARYENTYNLEPEDRWAVINAEQDKENVYQDVRRVVEARLVSHGFIEGNLSSPERRG